MDRDSVRTSVRVEKTGEDQDERAGNVALALISMLVTIGSGVVIFYAHGLKKDPFYAFSLYGLEVLQQPLYTDLLANGTFAVGLGMFISSFITATAAVLNKRCLSKFGLAAMSISCVFCMAGGIYTRSFLTGTNSDLQSTSPDTLFEGPGRELLDFTIQMYSECCLEEGYVKQQTAAFKVDANIPESDIEDNIREMDTCEDFYSQGGVDFTSFEQAIKSCYSSETALKYFSVATTDYVCDTLNDTVVDIAGKELFDIPLDSFTRGVSDIPILGSADVGTYGCGGGMAKSFQFVLYLWLLSVVEPVGLILMIIGILTTLGCFFGLASTCLVGGSNELELDMDVVQQYMNRNSVRLEAEAERNSVRSSQRISARVQVAVPVVDDVDDKI